jgi:hypothetical protein
MTRHRASLRTSRRGALSELCGSIDAWGSTSPTSPSRCRGREPFGTDVAIWRVVGGTRCAVHGCPHSSRAPQSPSPWARCAVARAAAGAADHKSAFRFLGDYPLLAVGREVHIDCEIFCCAIV